MTNLIVLRPETIRSLFTHNFVVANDTGMIGRQYLVCAALPHLEGYCAGTDGSIFSSKSSQWRCLSISIGTKGYPYVGLSQNGKPRTKAVHPLICEAFYGPRPFPLAQCRHLDGDPLNTRPLNLCWGTQAENWQDRKIHGRGMEGEKHHSAKFTDAERGHLRWAIERGLCSQKHASIKIGISQATVSALVHSTSHLRPEQSKPADRIPVIYLINTAAHRFEKAPA